MFARWSVYRRRTPDQSRVMRDILPSSIKRRCQATIAGCQSIMSKILIQFKREFKDAVYFVYGLHDSTNLAIWAPRWDEIAPRAKEIVEQPRDIFGVTIPFPASFKVRQNRNDTGDCPG